MMSPTHYIHLYFFCHVFDLLFFFAVHKKHEYRVAISVLRSWVGALRKGGWIEALRKAKKDQKGKSLGLRERLLGKV